VTPNDQAALVGAAAGLTLVCVFFFYMMMKDRMAKPPVEPPKPQPKPEPERQRTTEVVSHFESKMVHLLVPIGGSWAVAELTLSPCAAHYLAALLTRAADAVEPPDTRPQAVPQPDPLEACPTPERHILGVKRPCENCDPIAPAHQNGK